MRYIDTTELLKKEGNWTPVNGELWTNKELKKEFRNYFYNKCWYSEVKLTGSDIHIDHFRPKGKVVQYKNYNYNTKIADKGYHWLSNSIENYRGSCAFSNRRTGQGGKGNFFPLKTGSPHMTQDDPQQEIPMLLDPCCKEDVNLLTFDCNGEARPASTDSYEIQRADASIEIYNLFDGYMKVERKRTWQDVNKCINRYNRHNSPDDRLDDLDDLKELISREAPFSACAIAAVRSLAPKELQEQLELEL